ncbi:MAG: hypothetical protein CVV44_15985 [Spirochaetae bacterium HGW-Spirochaetae-1]|jgi:hypothetical protein|nr:MAG: hypothetical protein CVV44_15985 [Spirochaetae bacterium HGW-Spirochaetae-1]
MQHEDENNSEYVNVTSCLKKMINKKIYILIILMIIALCGYQDDAFAGTVITPTGNITATGLDDVENQIQNLLDNFGPGIANAYALGNIAGYPMGVAYLGGLGNFTVGLSLNAGLTNMKYFDKDANVGNDVLPFAGLNPVVNFGLGIGKKVDLLGKAFLFSTGFYTPPIDTSTVKLEKLNLYSFGGKLRYNWIEGQTLLPGIFSFGGVTLSAGGDFLYGLINLSGQYDYQMPTIEVDPDGAGGVPASEVELSYTSDYANEIKWFVLSVNLQALVYGEIYWIFNIYTGFGMSVNYGVFNFDLNTAGNVTTDDAIYMANNGGSGDVGTLTMVSSNKYKPYYFLPVYIIGFEVNLYIVRLSFESMVSLRNGSDINLQLGARTQF